MISYDTLFQTNVLAVSKVITKILFFFSDTPKMQEAIISSLIYVDKDNHRLHQFLARWTPKQVSAEFDLVFRDYVRSKPVHVWKKILSWKL